MRWVVLVAGGATALTPLAAAGVLEAGLPWWLAAFLTTGGWWTAVWRAFAVAVVVGPDRVAVRNLWREWTFTWDEVEGVAARERRYWLVLRNGYGVRLDAVSRRAAGRLARDVALHSAAARPDTD